MTDDRNAAVDRMLDSAGREWAGEAFPSGEFCGRVKNRLREERRVAARARILGMPRLMALRIAAVFAVIASIAAFCASALAGEEMTVAWTDGGVQFASRTLHDGDALSTGSDGRAVAMFDDGRVQAMVSPMTSLRVIGEDRLRLDAGEIWVSVEPDSGVFEISTPEARVAVKGTRFGVRHDGAGTTVTLVAGTVEVEAGGKASVLQPGASAVVPMGGGPAMERPMSAREPTWATALLADWHRSAAARRYPSGWNAEGAR